MNPTSPQRRLIIESQQADLYHIAPSGLPPGTRLRSRGEPESDELGWHRHKSFLEQIFEKVRREEFSNLPSRINAVFAARTLDEAMRWANMYRHQEVSIYSIRLGPGAKAHTADAENFNSASTRLPKIHEAQWSFFKKQGLDPALLYDTSPDDLKDFMSTFNFDKFLNQKWLDASKYVVPYARAYWSGEMDEMHNMPEVVIQGPAIIEQEIRKL